VALLALEATGKIQGIEEVSALVAMPVETVCEPNVQHHALIRKGSIAGSEFIKSYSLKTAESGW
jgi:hypothetical protein